MTPAGSRLEKPNAAGPILTSCDSLLPSRLKPHSSSHPRPLGYAIRSRLPGG